MCEKTSVVAELGTSLTSDALDHSGENGDYGEKYDRSALISLFQTLDACYPVGSLLPEDEGFAAISIASLVSDGVLPATHHPDSASLPAARRGGVIAEGRRARGRGRGLGRMDEDEDPAFYGNGRRDSGEGDFSDLNRLPRDREVVTRAPLGSPGRKAVIDDRSLEDDQVSELLPTGAPRGSPASNGRPFPRSPTDSEKKLAATFGSDFLDEEGGDGFFCDEEELEETGRSVANHRSSFLERVLKKKLDDDPRKSDKAAAGGASDGDEEPERPASRHFSVADLPMETPPPLPSTMPSEPPPQAPARPPVPNERPPPPPSPPPGPPPAQPEGAVESPLPTNPPPTRGLPPVSSPPPPGAPPPSGPPPAQSTPLPVSSPPSGPPPSQPPPVSPPPRNVPPTGPPPSSTSTTPPAALTPAKAEQRARESSPSIAPVPPTVPPEAPPPASSSTSEASPPSIAQPPGSPPPTAPPRSSSPPSSTPPSAPPTCPPLPSAAPPAVMPVGAPPAQPSPSFAQTAPAPQQQQQPPRMPSPQAPARTSLNLANALPTSAQSVGTGLQSSYQGYMGSPNVVGSGTLPVGTAMSQVASTTAQKATAQSQLNPAAPVYPNSQPQTSVPINPLDNPKAKCWWYRDPQGIVQGPFSTIEMRHWSSCGYFSPDLPIRLTENGQFYQLKVVYPGNLVPFHSPPAIGGPLSSSPPPKNPPTSVSATAAGVTRQSSGHQASARDSFNALSGTTAAQLESSTGRSKADTVLEMERATAIAKANAASRLAATGGYPGAGYGSYSESMAAVAASYGSASLKNMLGLRHAAVPGSYEEAMLNSMRYDEVAHSGLLGGDPSGLGMDLSDHAAVSRMMMHERWPYGTGEAKGTMPLGAYGAQLLQGGTPSHPSAEMWMNQASAVSAASLGLGQNMMNQAGNGDAFNGGRGEGLGIGAGSQAQAARQRGSRRKQAVGEAPLSQKPEAFMQPGSWVDHISANPPPAANINLSSSSDFPTLGGTPGVEEHVVMADTPVEESNGFWERPLRAVKVAAIDPSPKNGSRGNAGASSSPSAIPRKNTDSSQRQHEADGQVADRRVRIEELARQTNLHLDENVLGFLLTVSSAADVLDYLMALCGDTDDVRRFAQAFGEQRLGATDSKADREAKGPKESAEANAPKARRRRGKGKEVDPSLLGFTAASSRIMQGSIDHGD